MLRPVMGHPWLVHSGYQTRAEQAWVERGVHPNRKKTIDGGEGQEVQGYYVDPVKHWVGVSYTKRQHLFQATFHILQQYWVQRADIEGLVGKFGFSHSCRSIMRSVFEEVYLWLDQLRSQRVKRARLPDNIWRELFPAAILLPYCQFDLSANFSQRVECSDSSMTGTGRAWASMPADLVQLMAQLSDHPGVYTNLSFPHGISLDKQDMCPLRKLKLPRERFKWHLAGAPA